MAHPEGGPGLYFCDQLGPCLPKYPTHPLCPNMAIYVVSNYLMRLLPPLFQDVLEESRINDPSVFRFSTYLGIYPGIFIHTQPLPTLSKLLYYHILYLPYSMIHSKNSLFHSPIDGLGEPHKSFFSFNKA